MEKMSFLGEKEIFLSLSDDQAEKEFFTLLQRINNDELAKNKMDDFESRIDDGEITIQQACIELSEFVKKRNAALNQVHIENFDSTHETTKEARDIFLQTIRISENMPDCFLGNGAVAHVYSIATENKKLCVKIVKNRERYSEENTIHQEAWFLDKLRYFEKANVRTPHLKNIINSLDLTALVMEELEAANMARIIEGKDELPKNFDLEKYFYQLSLYVSALHSDMKVYHLDIAARNLMVDKKTGNPYLIDFGKSKSYSDIMGENFGTFDDIYRGKDIAGIAAAKSSMRQWIENQQNPKAVL